VIRGSDPLPMVPWYSSCFTLQYW